MLMLLIFLLHLSPALEATIIMKLFKSYHRLNIRANFFTQRVINNWNNLPNEVVLANSIGSFKSKLDDYWKQTGYGYAQRLTA